MAKLPRYQESGLISADIPRLDFANIKEEARFSSAVSESLDKISQFAFGKAQEQKKQADKLLAIQLRADYESDAQEVFNNLSLRIEKNELSFDQAKIEVEALKGYARTLAQYDIEQASGYMRSITTSGNALLRKSSERDVALYTSNISEMAFRTAKSLSKNLEDVWKLKATNQITDDEILQYEAGARSVMMGVAALSQNTITRYLGDGKDPGEFEKIRIAAKNNAMANYFQSQNFAPSKTATEMLSKLNSGDAGVYSDFWKNMTDDEKRSVTEIIEKQANSVQKVIQSQYTNANLAADPIIRQIINSNDPTEQTRLYGQLKELPLDPSKLRSVKEYVNSDQSGASTDDIRVLIDLSAKAARGDLSVNELVSNRSRLTKSTVKSLALQIANPNDAMSESNKVLELAVGIQSSNLPPEIPTAEGRAAAVNALNKAKLELIKFKNTPDENGIFPNDSMIRQKASELETNLSNSMSPIFNNVAQNQKKTAEVFIPELAGVDLTNDAAVEVAFRAATNRKPKPAKADDLAAARNAVDAYRRNINKAGPQQQGDRLRGGQ